MRKFFVVFLLLLSVIVVTAGCGAKSKVKTTDIQLQSSETASPDNPTGTGSEKSDSAGMNISDTFNQNAITNEMMKAANAYKDIYKTIDTKQYFNAVATDSQREQIVNRIGALGYPIVSEDINMHNPSAVQQFWQKAKAGEDAELGVYEVESDASLERYTFKVSSGKTFFICVTATWDSTDQPQIQYDSVKTVDKFELTSKGYFLYHTPAQNGLWENSSGFRVSPLPDENRVLCKKYIEPLGYQGNNILTSSWDQKTITKLNFNDMFEYIYRLEYQKEPDSSKYAYYCQGKVSTLAVPAADFERIITRYFPISAKELRQTAVYEPTKGVYPWQAFCGPQYAPDPEVVAYHTNADGSLTLTVDAVAIEYYSDCDFTDTVTVMPHKGGNFQYLSNSLKIYHSGQFPTYAPRIRKNS